MELPANILSPAYPGRSLSEAEGEYLPYFTIHFSHGP